MRDVPDIPLPRLTFTASRFVLESPSAACLAPEVLALLQEHFYRERAQEKLLPRPRHWERQTGLQSTLARIRVFQSR